MDNGEFVAYADRLRRSSRDMAMIKFLDHAIKLAQDASKAAVKFDRNSYQRNLMRKRRAADRTRKLEAPQG